MPNNLSVDFNDEIQLKDYIKGITDSKPITWEYRHQAIEHSKELSIHFKGEKPTKILQETRPNEPSNIKKYREEIFQPITKSKGKKVLNILQRINNSKNYSIKFPEETPKILGKDTLEAYTMNDYPFYGNIIQWVFDIVLKKDLVDPNAIICFRPINYEVSDTEFINPFGFIYSSENVIDFKIDEYYTILLNEKSIVSVGDQKVKEGSIYNVYTKNEIIELRQIGNKIDNKYQKTILFQHDIGEVPVITLGGEYVDDTFPFLYESFVSGVLPFWNKALRLDSDIDANYIQHLYLERVEIQVECDNPKCGKNEAKVGHVCENNKMYQCERCEGTGYITGRSPYGVTSVKKDALSGENIEFPGVTYVSKPTEIVEISERKLKSLIDDGFSAINMDILKDVGDNQSGVAKTIDRTDLDSYLTMVSNNLFDNIIYYSFYYINLLRYKNVMGEEAYNQMPTINKPTHFDVLSAQQVMAEITPNLPVQLKDVLLVDVINKRFPNDAFQREYNIALIELDPLRNKTEDEKLIEVSSQWVTKQDAILSANISKYILDAFQKDKTFFEKSREEKLKILYAMIPKTVTTKIPLVDSSGNNIDAGGGEMIHWAKYHWHYNSLPLQELEQKIAEILHYQKNWEIKWINY